MDALLAAGAEGATREELIQLSGTSTTSFYRVIKPMLDDGLVEFKNHQYRLLISSPYNFRYKMWRDAEKLLKLCPHVRTQVEDVVAQAQHELGSSLQALWLIGSAAHGSNREDSDLDFLAITTRESDFSPERIRREVQFICMTPATFRRKVKEQDSFVLSALRYGLLLEDQRFAQTWLDTPQSVQLEQTQIRHVQETLDAHRFKLLFYIKEQVPEEASRMLKAYAVTLGRALLAFHHELPAGKPDLIKTLRIYYGGNPIEETLYEIDAGSDVHWLRSYQALNDYWQVFCDRRGLLEITIGYPYSNGVQFEADSLTILERIDSGRWPDGLWDERGQEVQLDTCRILPDGQKVFIEAESTFGEIREETIDRFVIKLKCYEERYPEDLARGLFIANPYNKVRLSVRSTEVSPKLASLLSGNGISYLSSRELIQKYSQTQLAEQSILNIGS